MELENMESLAGGDVNITITNTAEANLENTNARTENTNIIAETAGENTQTETENAETASELTETVNDSTENQTEENYEIETQGEQKAESYTAAANTEKPIGVYVKLNDEYFVTDVNSDIFIKNFEGWTQIDVGYGDKYAHAQSQYFDKPLIDENGKYTIRL